MQVLKFMKRREFLHIETIWSDDICLPFQEMFRLITRNFWYSGEHMCKVRRCSLHAVPVVDLPLTSFLIYWKLSDSVTYVSFLLSIKRHMEYDFFLISWNTNMPVVAAWAKQNLAELKKKKLTSTQVRVLLLLANVNIYRLSLVLFLMMVTVVAVLTSAALSFWEKLLHKHNFCQHNIICNHNSKFCTITTFVIAQLWTFHRNISWFLDFYMGYRWDRLTTFWNFWLGSSSEVQWIIIINDWTPRVHRDLGDQWVGTTWVMWRHILQLHVKQYGHLHLKHTYLV